MKNTAALTELSNLRLIVCRVNLLIFAFFANYAHSYRLLPNVFISLFGFLKSLCLTLVNQKEKKVKANQ